MYTVRKTGALYQVLDPSGLVQFSSMVRANCRQWILQVEETQEEKESRFFEDG